MARYVVRQALPQDLEEMFDAPVPEEETIMILSDRQEQKEAVIVPGVGNQCIRYTWAYEGELLSLIAGPRNVGELRQNPMLYGNPILFPFPNRVRGGKFRFQKRDYTLPINEVERGHALHGFVFTRPWVVVEHGADDERGASITCRITSTDFPELHDLFPSRFSLEYTYRLHEGILKNEFTAINEGDEPMPFGFGVHPWFAAPITEKGNRGACRIAAPVSKIWELDEGLIPTGRVVDALPHRNLSQGPRLGGEHYDDVYAGLNEGGGPSHSRFADPGTGVEVVVIADESFRELVVYAPTDRNVVCIEPYTCTTDALNLSDRGVDSGIMILKPGERWSGWIHYAPKVFAPDTWPVGL